MKENTVQKRKENRKRRELLIIVLFQFASISLCVISLIFRVGGTLAEEFIPVAMHAANEGDYGADDAHLTFKKQTWP